MLPWPLNVSKAIFFYCCCALVFVGFNSRMEATKTPDGAAIAPAAKKYVGYGQRWALLLLFCLLTSLSSFIWINAAPVFT